MAIGIDSVLAEQVEYVAPTALLPAPDVLLKRGYEKVAVGTDVIVTSYAVIVINTRQVTHTDYIGEPAYINGKFYASKWVNSTASYDWFRSDDGFTWTQLVDAPTSSTLPSGNGVLLLAGSNAVSMDNGDSWQTLTLPSGFGQARIVQNSTALIAAHTSNQTVAMSFNNGATWTVGSLPSKTGTVYSIVDCAYNDGVYMLLFPTTNGSFSTGYLYIAFSFDDGVTWDRRSSGSVTAGPSNNAFIIPYEPGVWLVGAQAGPAYSTLFVTTFDGATWSSGYTIAPYKKMYKVGNTLVADDTSNKTAQRSVSSYSAWQASVTPPKNGNADNILTNGVVCVAVHNLELFISYDQGRSWNALNYSARRVPIDPKLSATRKDSRGLYCTAQAVGSYAYLLESSDGLIWSAVGAARAIDYAHERDLHAVRLHSDAHACTVYATNSGKTFDAGEMYVSWNDGATWSLLTVLSANSLPVDVALSGDESCFVWQQYNNHRLAKATISGYNTLTVTLSAQISALDSYIQTLQHGGIHPLAGTKFIVDTTGYVAINRDRYVTYDASTNSLTLVTASDTTGITGNNAFTLLKKDGGAQTTFDGVTFVDISFPDAGNLYTVQEYNFNNLVSGTHFEGVPVVSWVSYPNWSDPTAVLKTYAPSGLVSDLAPSRNNDTFQTSVIVEKILQPPQSLTQLQLAQTIVYPEWTQTDLLSDAYDLAASGNNVVGCGWWDADGAVFSSQDGGKTWSYFFVPNGGVYAITAGPSGTFIGVGEQKVDVDNNIWHPVVVKSTDNGVTWNIHYIRNDSDYSYFGAVSYNGAVYVAADSNMSKVYVSADGENWTEKDVTSVTGAGFGYLTAAVNSRLLVYGWNDSVQFIYSDDNGVTWTPGYNVDLLKPYPHVFDGVLYCFDDSNYNIWRSIDGGLTFNSVVDVSLDTGYYGSYWRQCIAKNTTGFYLFNTDTYEYYQSVDGLVWVKKVSVRALPANGGPSVGVDNYIVRGNSNGYGAEYGPTQPPSFWTGFINCEDV